jgi:hypothetical protein
MRNAPAVYDEPRRAGWRFAPPQCGLTFAAQPPEPLDRFALRRARDAGFFLVPCSVLDVTGSGSALRVSALAEPRCLRAALELLLRAGSEFTARLTIPRVPPAPRYAS